MESHGKLKLCLLDQLLQTSKQGQSKIEKGNQTVQRSGTHFGGHQSVICCTMTQVKNSHKTRIVLKVFESDSYT